MLIYLIGILAAAVYFYGRRNHDYWSRRGVKHEKPIPFFGNMFWQAVQSISISDMLHKHYWLFPEEKIVGCLMGSDPTLILRDPELIKHVLVTDFDHFYPRGLNPHKDVIEPMLKNLFFADGDLWKLLRQRMTPAFTTGKLKAMFPLIVERTDRLRAIALQAASEKTDVDVRELMARYTTDFIGACGFGIDADSLTVADSAFRKLGKDIFTITKRDGLVAALKMIMPDTFKHMEFLKPSIQQITVSLVRNIMTARNYKPSGRNDFIDLLLELKEKGKIVGESIEKRKADGTPETAELELDDLLMAAQVQYITNNLFQQQTS